MGDDAIEPRAKRRKQDKSGKFAALEKLKSLKGKGLKHKYEVSDIDNVYETVDEKEYTKKVLERQDEDWIVDDDGAGYVEDGRDIFDDDLDSESIAAAAAMKNKSKKNKKKALSESAGKGNLQYMLSNLPTKKKEQVKLDEDDVLSELIAEIDDSDTPVLNIAQKSTPSSSVISDKQAASNYMKSFTTLSTPSPVATKITRKTNVVATKSTENETVIIEDVKTSLPTPSVSAVKCPVESSRVENSAESKSGDCIAISDGDCMEITDDDCNNAFDDDLDISQIEVFQSQSQTNRAAKKKSLEDSVTEEQLMKGWETMVEGVVNAPSVDAQSDVSQLTLIQNEDNQKVFRFYWWDAFEDYYKQPGVVFLFGKTYCESTKSYISCCVTVKNIERKIYLLPRTHFLDKDNKPTDKPVALIDVYSEFNNDISDGLGIKVYRSKKVTKSYAFDPNIPAQSEYLQVRYSAKNPPMDKNAEGKTFSKVFGTNSSFLEIFLLDCKIKGPCWMDVKNPERVSNPMSWCKLEVNCADPSDISVTKSSRPIPPPPLVVSAINMRTAINSNKLNTEIVMMSCLTHTKYAVDKQPPNPPFQQHFCVFTKPGDQVLPLDLYDAVRNFKGTRVQKVDSEKAVLNYFLGQLTKVDPDLIVGHDLKGYQISVLCGRLLQNTTIDFSRFGKLRRKMTPNKNRLERELFLGRLVCDLKISTKELIKSRSYDLDTLCQTVLKMKEGQRIDFELQDIPKIYQSSTDILKLISFTMQDTAYILKMMYELNVIPLALQITNIAGNVMSKTLLGGRSERNEFLLMHAFDERDYIVPDKGYINYNLTEENSNSKKKPAYSGGLVLEPKVGFYDKFILLMDFNSLYPSIIQEYNICFTTVSGDDKESVLPDRSVPPGVLPTEIRKLVESRKEVKKMMTPDITEDLRMQLNIRQMALKLTANSMYGCLGFANSRFCAKRLAALVTLKGREILTNTKVLVEKLGFEVIYGDTDSIMINTNMCDYDQVIKIGHKIKQEVNRLYRQVELDIDGVFKYLLLLKKKKYAAVTLTKTKSGELKAEQEHKGLDIVRRDWSQLASTAGKFILEQILSDQSPDDRIGNIQMHLGKLKKDLEDNLVPLPLLVVTKQLTKDPTAYPDKNSLPHVQVALRHNEKGGKPFRAGDTVSYVICDDGTNSSATQRAYLVDELKNNPSLKIDVKYYLSQQIHPVITRLCEPIEGIDGDLIADWLGLDESSFKRTHSKPTDSTTENIRQAEVRFKTAEPFTFRCLSCKKTNSVEGVYNGHSFLQKCANDQCTVCPIEYLPSIKNQLQFTMRNYIKKYYTNVLVCEDPGCPNETTRLPLRFVGKYPVCTFCQKGVMYKKYTEYDLYSQLSYFQYIFDLSKAKGKVFLDEQTKSAYNVLKEMVDKILKHSGYNVVDLTEMFSKFVIRHDVVKQTEEDADYYYYEDDKDDDDF